MAEENQFTTKDPKKVKAGKRLAEYNCRKREELKVQCQLRADITVLGLF